MLFAQAPPEGIWQGYDGEWRHVSRQLIALAEATPAEKFAWRPAAGVRSTSEVYMHIAVANFYLLSVTGPKMPAGLKQDMEKTVASKAEVIDWLKRSLGAVKEAHLAAKPNDLERKVHIADRDATVDGMYLPQWSPQNRPTVVRAKPANGKRPGTKLFYPAASCGGKSIFVRQLRGPHLST